jgi:hypothetical protein
VNVSTGQGRWPDKVVEQADDQGCKQNPMGGTCGFEEQRSDPTGSTTFWHPQTKVGKRSRSSDLHSKTSARPPVQTAESYPIRSGCDSHEEQSTCQQ